MLTNLFVDIWKIKEKKKKNADKRALPDATIVYNNVNVFSLDQIKRTNHQRKIPMILREHKEFHFNAISNAVPLVLVRYSCFNFQKSCIDIVRRA